jgi:hypothetical protein
LTSEDCAASIIVVVVWVVVVHVGLVMVVMTMVMVMAPMVMVMTVDQVIPLVMDHIGIVHEMCSCPVVTMPSLLQ